MVSGLLERLADAEMQADPPLLRLSVHEQALDRVQLVADVQARGANGRHVTQPGTGGVLQVAGVDAPRVGPDVAVIEERHRPELAEQRDAYLRRSFEHRQA